MRRIAVLVLLSTFLCCDYFDEKNVTSEEILQEELQTFNWNEVDVYPTFDSCNELEEKQEKKECFQQTLTNHINNQLSKQVIVVSDSISDLLNLTLEIDKKGNLSVQNIEMKPETSQQIPSLDSLLIHSFDSLPKIYPALKRSQQVTTRFVLPVQIKIE